MTDEPTVVNQYLGHDIWTTVRNSPRISWGTDEKLKLTLNTSRDSKGEFIRTGQNEYSDPDDWAFRENSLSPRMKMNASRVMERTYFTKVGLFATPHTSLGAAFTFEYRQETGDRREGTDPNEWQPALLNPIRIPAPKEMHDEIRDWAKSEGGEVTRIKGVLFEDRFLEDEPTDESFIRNELSDVHVKIPDIETERRAFDLWEQAFKFTNRATRKVRSFT